MKSLILKIKQAIENHLIYLTILGSLNFIGCVNKKYENKVSPLEKYRLDNLKVYKDFDKLAENKGISYSNSKLILYEGRKSSILILNKKKRDYQFYFNKNKLDSIYSDFNPIGPDNYLDIIFIDNKNINLAYASEDKQMELAKTYTNAIEKELHFAKFPGY